MTLGIGSFLNVQNIVPQVDWIFTLLLGMLGILTPFVFGFDKVTFVLGPFLMIATVFSLLRQLGYVSSSTEITLLVIIVGVLMLLSRFLPVPVPRWFLREPDEPVSPSTESEREQD